VLVRGRERRAPVFDLWSKQRPVGAWLVLVGQSDAAGVDDADAAHRALELHVVVADDDEIRRDAGKEGSDVLLRGRGDEDVDVVPRRGMTKEHSSHSV